VVSDFSKRVAKPRCAAENEAARGKIGGASRASNCMPRHRSPSLMESGGGNRTGTSSGAQISTLEYASLRALSHGDFPNLGPRSERNRIRHR